jgi:hypothetical protein
MPTIDPNKLTQFRSYTPVAAGVMDDATKVKTVDNNVSVISFFDPASVGGAKAFLSAKPSPVTDAGKLAKAIDATPEQLNALKSKPADFGAHLKAQVDAKKDYFYPTFGALEGAPTRYKFNAIVGARVDQFVAEATKLATELYPAGAARDTALRAVNTMGRDLMARKVEFDKYETNGYASFGHDAAFIHVYERKLEQLEKMDLGLLTPDQKASVGRQKQQLQGELDDIFRHKYVYNNSSMYEVNAEVSMGLVAIAKGSRQRVSEKESTIKGIVPQFETLNVQHQGQNKAVFYDHSEKKYFFDRTSQQVPAELVASITRTPVDADDVTFRRAVSGEQLRKNFRFDWDGDGYVQQSVIDWVSWAGHCNDKAALEASGLVLPDSHKGVYEYDSAAGTTVHYTRDLLNEKLLSFSEMGSAMGKKTGGQAVKDIGATEFASARDDDRPDKLVLSNGREIPYNGRPNKFEITSVTVGGKSYSGNDAFSEYVVAADKKSATKNPLYSGTTDGDYNNIKLDGGVVNASIQIQVFSENSGYPEMVSKNIALDFKNPPAEPVLVDTLMKDPAKREMYEVKLDLKNKQWVYDLVRMEEQPDGKFKKVSLPGGGKESFDPAKTTAKRESSLDNPSTYLPFVDGAMKTGRNATAETADGAGVWNGRVIDLEKKLELREGDWERVAVDVSARYGSNSGSYLAHLDAKGQPDFYVPIEMPADFWWRQQITFAPEKDGLVNVTARDRGVLSVEGGAVKSDAVDNMLEVLHVAFSEKNYTVVHDGKRHFFNDEASWKKAVDELNALRGAVYSGGPVGPTPVIAEVVKDAGKIGKGAVKQYSITAEADGPITIKLGTKTGDADLFVKKGGAASNTDHTLKSEKGGTESDTITIEAKKGETYGLAVYGYKESDFELVATAPKVGAPPPPPAPEPVAFHLAGRVGKNEESHFQIEIQADGELDVNMDGSGDADVYLRVGSKPTKDAYDHRPYLDGSDENLKVKVKKGDILYGMVRGFAASSDFDLNIKSS